MITANGKTNEVVPCFTSKIGRTAWWNLQLWVELVAGAGASVEIKVNGNAVPAQTVSLQVGVDSGTFPKREAFASVRLENGDVVTAKVEGPGTVNFELSGDVADEALPQP